jgi:hypothetical protein
MFALAAMLTYGDGHQAMGRPFKTRMAIHTMMMDTPVIREMAIVGAGAFEISDMGIGLTLADGQSVAFVPDGVRGQVAGEEIKTSFPDLSYRCWWKPVVPVWCPSEYDVCWVWRPWWLKWLRDWAMAQPFLRYPLGTLFCPKPPWMVPPLVVVMGRMVDPRRYDSLEAFTTAFNAELDIVKKRARVEMHVQ